MRKQRKEVAKYGVRKKIKKVYRAKILSRWKNVRVPLHSYKINSKPSYQSKNVYFRASQAL